MTSSSLDVKLHLSGNRPAAHRRATRTPQRLGDISRLLGSIGGADSTARCPDVPRRRRRHRDARQRRRLVRAARHDARVGTTSAHVHCFVIIVVVVVVDIDVVCQVLRLPADSLAGLLLRRPDMILEIPNLLASPGRAGGSAAARTGFAFRQRSDQVETVDSSRQRATAPTCRCRRSAHCR
jgi:hypothetical protein